MGRPKRNTVQKSVWMHQSLVKEVRNYAKKRTDEEISKEKNINSKKE